MNKHPEDNIPEQVEGASSNTEASKEFESINDAKVFYKMVQQRLLDVNHWHELAGAATSDFQLTDEKGNEVKRPVRLKDHFKINIPGPGSATGDGYDWVQVEDIEEVQNDDEEGTTIVVKPVSNPKNNNTDVAHFYTNDARSCFMALRRGKKVTAGVFGRNEKPNINVEKAIDKARNAAVATSAISFFGKLQWKNLVNGLVR